MSAGTQETQETTTEATAQADPAVEGKKRARTTYTLQETLSITSGLVRSR